MITYEDVLKAYPMINGIVCFVGRKTAVDWQTWGGVTMFLEVGTTVIEYVWLSSDGKVYVFVHENSDLEKHMKIIPSNCTFKSTPDHIGKILLSKAWAETMARYSC